MDSKKPLKSGLDLAVAGQAWLALTAALGGMDLGHTRANANRIMALVDRLVEATSSETAPPGVEELLEFFSQWLEGYESVHQQMPAMPPVELLKHLMESNGLKQADLASDFGGQSAVSAVLNGKRKINIRQARSLASRFKLNIDAFLEQISPETEPTVEDRGTATLVLHGAVLSRQSGFSIGERREIVYVQ